MVGLDIGTYSIKIVELQKKDNCYTLLNYIIQKRPPVRQFLNELKKITETTRFVSREATISVSGHLAVARLIELPLMNDEELKNAIGFEIERHLPYKIDEAIMDYKVLLKDSAAKKCAVLFAASKKEIITKNIEEVSQAGFIVKGVDVDGIALTNAFLNSSSGDKEKDDKAAAIFNIGNAFVNISVIYKGMPYILRDVGVAGGDFLEAVSRGLGVGDEEAYKLLHNPPEDKKELIFEMIRPSLMKLMKEIRLSMGYFENQFSKGIDVIYLTGGSSRLFGMKDFMSEYVDAPIEMWDPFSLVKISDTVSAKSFEEDKRELSVALGLALRDD